MSDSPLASLALGYLAAGPMVETASQGALMLTRALRERRSPTIDASALLAAAQELEAHVSRQEAYIADLQREVRELREHARHVEAERDRLFEYGKWAEQELKRRPPRD